MQSRQEAQAHRGGWEQTRSHRTRCPPPQSRRWWWGAGKWKAKTSGSDPVMAQGQQGSQPPGAAAAAGHARQAARAAAIDVRPAAKAHACGPAAGVQPCAHLSWVLWVATSSRVNRGAPDSLTAPLQQRREREPGRAAAEVRAAACRCTVPGKQCRIHMCYHQG